MHDITAPSSLVPFATIDAAAESVTLTIPAAVLHEAIAAGTVDRDMRVIAATLSTEVAWLDNVGPDMVPPPPTAAPSNLICSATSDLQGHRYADDVQYIHPCREMATEWCRVLTDDGDVAWEGPVCPKHHDHIATATTAAADLAGTSAEFTSL